MTLEGGPLATPLPQEPRDTKSSTQTGPAPGRQVGLMWRVFLVNATLVIVATLILALTPATVSTRVTTVEMAVLLMGAVVVLAVNLLALRQVLGPLRQLTEVMTNIDPERPGRRVASASQDSEIRTLTATFNAMLDRLEGERRQSARLALAAQERERLRVAQELHDQIGQGLTAVMLQAERGAQGRDGDDAQAFLAIAASVRSNLDEVRGIARRLRPEALDDLGLVNALIALCRRIGEDGAVRVERRFAVPLPALAPDAELVIYRVAQEALTNVVRHASASEAVVFLEHDERHVTLEVSDNGRGIDPDRAAGSGIRGMRERSLLVGGRLEIKAGPRGGTMVRLEVPPEPA